jgi:hypothetical protein
MVGTQHAALAQLRERSMPAERSMSHSALGRSSSCRAGVRVRPASATGANAETMSDTGAMTLLRAPPSLQVVRMDSESLPTGIAIPSAGHNCLPTACTVA